jgi:Outer membrane protein beta-barrel domain
VKIRVICGQVKIKIMENKFNREFEDLGWANMQKLLDRDMPVKEKKRRGLVFWLFLMGGLVAFSGTFFYLNNKKEALNSIANNSELNSNPLNNGANKIELNKGNKGLNKPELSTKSTQLNSVINSFELNNSALNNGVNNYELINKNKELNTFELNNYAAQTSNIKGLIESISLASNLGNLENQLVGNQLGVRFKPAPNLDSKTVDSTTMKERATVKVTPTNDAGATFTVALVNVDVETPPQYMGEKTTTLLLKTVDFQLLKACDSLFFSEAIKPLYLISEPLRGIVLSSDKSSKTHFGMTTGIHTEGGQKIDGWQIGLMANKYLTKKWAIYAGLNYRKTMVQVDSLSDLKLGYVSYGSTSTTPVSVQNPSLIPVKKIILKQLNYLELPIGVNYNFNKKWAASAGIKMAYLMSPNVGISADSTVFFLKEAVSNKVANYALDQSNSVAALGLQRWDIAAIGGINYNINNKISLSLRYDYGFKNVLNRANWAAYNRFVGFNAVYYFR